MEGSMGKTLLDRLVLGQITLFCVHMFVATPCPAENKPVSGSVIFEDTFDSQPNWSKTASPPHTSECNYPPCAEAPEKWSAWRAAPWLPPASPPVSISGSVTSDHTTGTGKAMIVRVQSVHSGSNFASDAILSKVFTQNYPELYVRFWLKTQSGWQWDRKNNNAHKVFRLFHYDGTNNFFKNGPNGSESPLTFFDLATYWVNNSARYSLTYRCSPVSNYFCKPGGGPENGISLPFNSKEPAAPGNWADGEWHRYDLHFKLNTGPGISDGVSEFWYDGKRLVSHNNITWITESSTREAGWNSFSLGGNSKISWGPDDTPTKEQWYAIDDVVISTAPIPDNHVIGGAGKRPAAHTKR